MQTEHFRLELIDLWQDYFAIVPIITREPHWHTVPISTLSELWLRQAIEKTKILLRIDVLPPGNLVLNIGLRVSKVSKILSACELALRMTKESDEQAAIRALYEETITLLQYRKPALISDLRGELTIESLARNYDRW